MAMLDNNSDPISTVILPGLGMLWLVIKDHRSDAEKEQNRTLPTLKYVLLLAVLHYPFATAIFRPREQAYWWEGLRTF
jgi:hypothetical protein